MAWQQVRQFSTFLLKNQSQLLRIHRGNPLLRINQKSTFVKSFAKVHSLELHEAANKGLLEESKTLIKKGADVNACNSIGE